MEESRATTERTPNTTALLFCGGLMIVALYYAMASLHGAGGHLAPAQPDALIYMQYARSMAEGHAYEFVPGAGRSTGSTSHLYPFLLSLLYRSGARGESLFTATFFLNAVFYLFFVFFAWLAARRVAPKEAALAALLILLNGHLSSTAMGMSDMGLFMMVSMGTFAAALHERPGLTGLGLAVCVWSRPEGVVLSVVFLGLALLVMVRRTPPRGRGMAAAALAGVVAALAMLWFNHHLTGDWQFQSVARKGHLATYPMTGAIVQTVRDFYGMLREVFFGVSDNFRQAYFFPVLGGLLALVGMAAADWKSGSARWKEAWWLLSCLASVVLIALGAQQFVNMDRYLGWILPAWYLYAASGARRVSALFPTRGAFFAVVGVLLAGYELACLPFFVAAYASDCLFTQSRVTFSKSVDAQIPPGQSIGVASGAGLRYVVPGRRFESVSGIESPVFGAGRSVLCGVEILKHRPELRFDWWLVAESQKTSELVAGLLGPEVVSDFDAMGDPTSLSLSRADWTMVDGVADGPILPAARQAVKDMTMVDRLDVGYPEDEVRCSYRALSRLPSTKLHPFAVIREMDGRRVTEIGQAVIGVESFAVRVTRGKPLRIVMRTALDAVFSPARASLLLRGQGMHLKSPLVLRPVVNGRSLPEIAVAVECAEDQMSEVVIDVPAEYVDSDRLHIVLGGDHIAFAYWFYQSKR